MLNGRRTVWGASRCGTGLAVVETLTDGWVRI